MTKATIEDDFVDAVVNVRYAETDQMGVAHHANYLVWFEVGRVAWCKAKGFHYAEMEATDGCYLMVGEATCRYKAPAHFEEDLIIRTSLARANDRVIRYRYAVIGKEKGQLLATGETAHVVTGRNHRPARLPERYRAYFSLPAR